ncbi:MAG: DNA mismatch repair protein MutS [Brevinema sp.]
MSKTPMEQQYDDLKSKHQDKILLFRLGDFYEVFNDDAQIAANILNIAMTKRHNRVMCGFPYHALDQYAYKLVEAGHKVAICEQVEDVSQAKGLVKRDIVSVLTKGTWGENPLLDHSINSFLAILYFLDGELAIIFADISTGEVIVCTYADEHPLSFLNDELSRFIPVETICTRSLLDHFPIEEELKVYQNTLRIVDQHYFQDNKLYQSYQKMHEELFISLSQATKTALMGLFAYLEENHFSDDLIKHLKAPYQYEYTNVLFMNDDTLRHLELIVNAHDFGAKNTLFSVLNKTKTMPASRKLRRLLVTPSANYTDIIAQLERTDYFYLLNNTAAQGLSDLLKGMSDLERLIARLITGKILPRECLSLSDAVQRSEKLKNFLLGAKPFQHYFAALISFDSLLEKISSYINPDCSNMIDGSVIAKGVHAELDEWKKNLYESKEFLIKLQAQERMETGISTLKIAYNKIYGYYIEISKGAAKQVPDHYVRKQSLVNAERFTIPELESFEQKMTQAESMVISLENQVYQQLISDLQKYYHELLPLSEFVTEVDLRLALATVAKNQRFIKPLLTENFEWEIQDGRHPVIESLLKKERFVSNNTNIEKNSRVLIVTGPNMAGKSTYLRQNALFAVMAQIGSFVPAKNAKIGIIDKIFTRIGASDDLSSGRSTFYVEMQEAAFIINNATPKSLVIMDELGRGTSTQDGLALAWAILEYFLINAHKKCKLFFSTHYHELTELGKLNHVKNLCMAIEEKDGKPIFLRKVTDGKASKSYGVHVAEMAGLESSIVKRASQILIELEKGTFFHTPVKQSTSTLPFDSNDLKNQHSDVIQKISDLNINTLTPLNALNILSELILMIKNK